MPDQHSVRRSTRQPRFDAWIRRRIDTLRSGARSVQSRGRGHPTLAIHAYIRSVNAEPGTFRQPPRTRSGDHGVFLGRQDPHDRRGGSHVGFPRPSLQSRSRRRPRPQLSSALRSSSSLPPGIATKVRCRFTASRHADARRTTGRLSSPPSRSAPRPAT